MEFEIYFSTQVCVYNNFSKCKISRSLYVTSSYKEKRHMNCLIWETMNPYSQTFLLMHKEHLSTSFDF